VVSQFPGEKDIVNLKYIPAGYLPGEANEQAYLIERSRRYLQYGSKPYFLEWMGYVRLFLEILEPFSCWIWDSNNTEITTTDYLGSMFTPYINDNTGSRS